MNLPHNATVSLSLGRWEILNTAQHQTNGEVKPSADAHPSD